MPSDAKPPPDALSAPDVVTGPLASERLADIDGGLRRATARGTIINAAFLTGVQTLNLVKGFVVAVFLTTGEYGIWGLLAVSLGTLGFLKEVGIGDKYIQQDESDQELAFQKAFTLEFVLDLVLLGVVVLALPGFALLYDQSQILAPGLVMAAAIPAVALQAPLWIHYRRLRFARQRALQSVDPIVAFVVTVVLAAAGAGYWSLIIGLVCGAWAGAIAAVASSPYRLRLRYDRGTLRAYAGFSWPLFLAQASGIAVAQLAVLFGNAELGLAGVGVITLATLIAQYAEKVDAIVTATIYPAICAVRDRTDLLLESFVKSNRLAMMWGIPVGVGTTLFAADLIDFVIGDEWLPALTLIQVYGLIAAANQVGFNWSAFFRARGETRPIAVVGVISLVVFCAVALPLLASDGLDGFAIGMGACGAALLLGRTFYLHRFFESFGMLAHTARALAPSIPAVAVVLGVRALESGERTPGLAAAELVAYAGLTIAATLVLERTLLREIAGYLRRAG